MKAVLQDFRNGNTALVEVPAPGARPGHLLIRTTHSLLSTGTERMLVEFGKANLVEKARRQPDKVRQVLDKVKTDGLLPTVESVMHKLGRPLAMGYCNVGVVETVGTAVTGFAPGDRVASNGSHAEVVCVPANLCARIPDGVDDESATFTVLGAIALESVRLVAPALGEACVVSGLGLVGLLCAQLLRASGCRVLGTDVVPSRLAIARTFGIETVDLTGADPVAAGLAFSRGRGVDAVIVAASTSSSEPIHQAAQMSRRRGRIVLVGVTGLDLLRADFYEKELTFQVSCSYGPGRYDPAYEEGGHDYPFGFVRWTEQRNFEAVLDTLASGGLDVSRLISHRFPFEHASEAYAILTSPQPQLGILLEYPSTVQPVTLSRTVFLDGAAPAPMPPGTHPAIGFIGSGNYASQILIPAFKKTGARLSAISSAAGISGAHNGRKFGFATATTDASQIFADPSIDAIVIATRHDTHPTLVAQALQARKHVFCEKPLAIDREGLAQVEQAYAESARARAGTILMVGFNRRFAPHVRQISELLAAVREPRSFVMTVNAGAIPAEHWTQDRRIGGGRIIGEACHYIDLLRFLAGSAIVDVQSNALDADKVSFELRFADGSIGSVHYLANGHRSFPKERLEVFCGGAILQLDNFRRLRGYGWPGFKGLSSWRQDKGQGACAAAFVDALDRGEPSPIPFDQLSEVARASFDVAERAAGMA
jgi:predicted dehydrogenase/threonine dehydrogenase-like Zn-dependent dehydrogenase